MNRISTLSGLAATILAAGSLGAQPEFNYSFEMDPEFWTAEAMEEPWLLEEGDAGPKLLMLGKRSFLGVNVSEIDSERAKALKLKEERGVEITRVEEGSPADKAGLKKGDVVLEYNDQRVEGTEQFVRMVRETPAGRQVKLLVSREGTTQTIAATIGSSKDRAIHIAPKVDFKRLKKDLEELKEFRVPEMPHAFMSWKSTMLGIEAESIEAQLAEYFGVKEGVLVRSVLKDTPAEKAGIKAGDVIVKVDEEKVTTPREVSRAVRTAKAKKIFPISVFRKGKEMTLSVTIDGEERSSQEAPKGERIIRKTELRY
jgi:serine protease Do